MDANITARSVSHSGHAREVGKLKCERHCKFSIQAYLFGFSSLLVVLVEPALKKKTKNCYS